METSDENLIDTAVRTLARERSAKLNGGCQKRRLSDDIGGAVIHWAVGNELTPRDAEFWFGHAMDWLDELQIAANPLCRSYGAQENENLRKSLDGAGQSLKDPLGVIWIRRDLVRAVDNEKSPDALWRVDMDGVSECAGEYLRQPWANVPSVERLMVEMLTFSEALAFAQAAKIEVSGLLGPVSPFVRWPWTVFNSLVRLAAILYVAYGAAEMFGLWAGLLGASAMYYFLRIPPAPLLADRVRKAKLLEEMQSVYQILGHSAVCPALVRERIYATSNIGVVWPSGMPSLIEYAARRNPARWE